LKLRQAGNCAVNFLSESLQSRQKYVQTGLSAAVEPGLEAGCADDMPEVYKIPMVRMLLQLTKPRMNGSRRMGGRNAAAV